MWENCHESFDCRTGDDRRTACQTFSGNYIMIYGNIGFVQLKFEFNMV